MAQDARVRGYHHVTFCVGSAQEDYDFHVKALGLRLGKKTVLFDGQEPIYHLYYGNGSGDEGTLLTSFPMSWRPRGQRGSGQVTSITLSAPAGSLSFWKQRLTNHGYHTEYIERFGERRVVFDHPAGIEYEIMESVSSEPSPWTGAGVDGEVAIRSIGAVTVSARDIPEFDAFLKDGMGFAQITSDGPHYRYAIDDGTSGKILEVLHEPEMPQGTWTFAQGVVHHIAFDMGDRQTQQNLKLHLEGLGFTDVSEPKDRNYFTSVYFRTPAGVLFEAAVTNEGGWLKDETLDSLGDKILLPPWLESERGNIIPRLEPIVAEPATLAD